MSAMTSGAPGARAGALRAAPVTVPCALALGLVAWWALDAGGFELRHWAPGGVALLGLLAVALVAAPNDWAAVPRPVALAAAGLAAYAVWSFASIGWADDPGYALEGATRTLLYVVAFLLFALWPQTGRTGAALVAAWVAIVAVAGAVVAWRLAAAGDLDELFNFDRLRAPTGYPNATAALLMMPVLPAVVLSAARAVPWWARGAFAATATGLACLALLTVSRGAVYSAPLVLGVLFLLVPGRVRHFYALLPVAAGVAVCAPRLIDVGEAVEAGGGGPAALTAALWPAVAATAVAGVLVAVVARLEGRTLRPAVAERVATGARVVAVAVVALGLVGAVAVVGDPVDRATTAWDSFKGGYAENDAEANRLVGGLGSARYDFYRVGLRAWADRPLTGVGADGFYQQYLRDGESAETPRYPHSVEVRALVQTGAIGALLLFGALGAALVAALRAMRTGGALRRAAAGAATLGFAFWLVHGSLDWFWEWPGLGLPAFCLLGLACALSRSSIPGARDPAHPGTPLVITGAVACAVVFSIPFATLWAADRQQRQAAAAFAADPLAAYAHLDRAASLNPFSSTPETLAGSIALRYGDLPRADAAFARALRRVPDDQYATLERGAIASAQGRPDDAIRALSRAAELAPRDELAREALRIVRRAGTVDVAELNRRILAAARELSS